MAEYFAVAVKGISSIEDLDKLDPAIVKAARLAVNATVRRGQTKAARSMERQIRFPRGYLTGADGRLAIAKFASGSDLEALLRGRDRPTSLARFVAGGAKVGQRGGVSVEVDPGIAKFMPGAFAIKLRNNNIGLAVRTKNPPSVGAKKLSESLYLLYGPSVDQVFNKTRDEISDDLGDYLNAEFQRLLDLEL
jgi:hypothetical protein